MATKLGSIAVGNTIKLLENGALVDYRIVHQGLPSSLYDESCNGTWVMRETIHSKRAWDSADNNYKNSDIHSWLNGDFFNLFDSKTQALIKQVKIPYVNGTGNSGSVASGANGLSTKIFLLGNMELYGSTTNNSPNDGSYLSYFSNCASTDPKRIAYYNGTATGWWTRSASTNATNSIVSTWTAGSKCIYYYYDTSVGVRPAMVLNSDTMIDESTGEPVFNEPPSAPTGLTYADPKAGKQMGVTWNASTDPDGDAITYTVEKSLDGGAYIEAGQTTGTNLPINIPAVIYPGDDVAISWPAALGAGGYAIQRSVDNGQTWADLATTDGTSYTDKAPGEPCTLAAKNGALVQVKYRVASMIDGEVATNYTESATVRVYVAGGEI